MPEPTMMPTTTASPSPVRKVRASRGTRLLLTRKWNEPRRSCASAGQACSECERARCDEACLGDRRAARRDRTVPFLAKTLPPRELGKNGMVYPVAAGADRYSEMTTRRKTVHLQAIRRGVIALAVAAGVFATDALADSVPTGLPASPTFGITKFSQPMPRFDVLPRNPVSTLNPAPTAESNQTQQPVDPALVGRTSPIE